MSEPNISARYRELCPGITGRIITAHEAAEADAMRAALVDALIDEAWTLASNGAAHRSPGFGHIASGYYRRAAMATVLALLLAPEAA